MPASQKAGERLSRRRFLGLCAASAGGVTALGDITHASASEAGDSSANYAVLIDVTRCVGCGNCQRSCIQSNRLTPATDELNRLSAENYTFVDRREVSGGQSRSVKRQCMHCVHPACVSACTVGALQRTEDGLVVVDTGRCIGCRYCQYACPFGVPQFEWENTLGVVRKCTSCLERLANGAAPACAAGCPSGALKFGQRGNLLEEAHARLAAAADRYLPHVYGEDEVGGTNRLYISDVSFAGLGLPALDMQPAPRYAESVMTRTPFIALGVAAVCTGLYTVLRRREDEPAETTNEEKKQP